MSGIEFDYFGRINVKKGKSPRSLYEHQEDAMSALNSIDKKNDFATLLVLPTGGGKTLTGACWLLKEAVNKNKKVLWIAHRHLLLEQAADTFKTNAYENLLYNISGFNYRIVSGQHDRPIHIKHDDDVLIISKDCVIRNLNILDGWLKDEEEIYFVIDEAHHATAKSYRAIIEYVNKKVKHLKILGLTATPFRTADNEQGLLAKIFTDDIVYKIDLKELIKKGILSRPEFEECETDILLGESMGLKAIRSIEQLDSLPDDIANEIADNKTRNAKIVRRYLENMEKYEQTLVFAINRNHAFTLRALFQKRDVPAGVIVSGTSAEFIGVDISNEINEKNMKEYRAGILKVLINVNILTEGVDLPKTKTVFLTRPTVSSILMTQMVGRALRGEKAGGTKEAYIVSFIDQWQEKIAWVNAEKLIEDENEFEDKSNSNKKREFRLVSIAKIEEFAKILDDTVDTTRLENVEFIKRIPLGMYVFSFIDVGQMERNYQVLVYDSTKLQYDEMLLALPEIFKEYEIYDEMIPNAQLVEVSAIIEETYFAENMLPSYDPKDIQSILKYYAQKACIPTFIPFDEVDRRSVDISIMAKKIHDEDMRLSEQTKYTDQLWNDNDSLLSIYFSKKIYFVKQLQTEISKLQGGVEEPSTGVIITRGRKDPEDMTLYELSKYFPELARQIKDSVYQGASQKNGFYICKHCGKLSLTKAVYQIDHIIPMAKGGKTKIENLQLLCGACNKKKGDK